MFYWFIYYLTWIPLKIIYPTRVIGRHNVPKQGKCILSPNHQTLNDPIIIFGNIHRKFNYMAKAPLFEKKAMNWFLRKMGAYPVHHQKNDITAVKHTLKLLKDNEPIVIFPEGMRIKSSESNEIKHGVANFAIKTKTPIVPAVFVKKTNAFTPNTLIIGKPFDLSAMPEFQGGLDHEKLDKAGAIISKEIYTLKRDYVNKKIRKVTNFYNLQIWDLYNQMYEKWSKAKLAKYDKISKPFIRAITHTQLKMTKKVFKLQKKYGVDNSQIIQAQTVTIA